MPTPDWNERYETGFQPWDTGEPDPILVDHFEGREMPRRGLEVGCGTGTNALWLARRGCETLGVDVAPTAIEQARAKLAGEELACRFAVHDFLDDELAEGPFDFVFDRGCFHCFDGADDRRRFAERVAAVLRPEGRWLSLIGSTEGPARDHGPPRRSLRDIVHAVEPTLEIVEIRTARFHADIPSPAAAWVCVARRRTIPAQPSTRR